MLLEKKNSPKMLSKRLRILQVVLRPKQEFQMLRMPFKKLRMPRKMMVRLMLLPRKSRMLQVKLPRKLVKLERKMVKKMAKTERKMERKKEKVNSHLQMEVTMRANSNKMKYVGMESTIGLMENIMKESGLIIKCMVKAL